MSRIFLILTVITSALAAPVQEQEMGQTCVDAVHVPEDVITVLEKRILPAEKDLDVIWTAWWHFLNVLGKPPPRPQLPLARVHVPPHNLAPADSDHESVELDGDAPPKYPESDSDWSMNANALSEESQSEKLKAADSALIQSKGKAKVSEGIYGTPSTSGVDKVDADRMESPSAVNPEP